MTGKGGSQCNGQQTAPTAEDAVSFPMDTARSGCKSAGILWRKNKQTNKTEQIKNFKLSVVYFRSAIARIPAAG